MIFLPFNKISPAVGVSNPANIRNSVDLPQPDEPNKAKISPLLIVTDTSFTTRLSPKSLIKFLMSKKGCPFWDADAVCVVSVVDAIKALSIFLCQFLLH